MSMISPLKIARPASALEERNDEILNRQRSARKSARGNDSYSKKSVTRSIHSIKEAIHGLTETIRNLKEKSRGLLVQFNPLFTYVLESNVSVARHVGDLRNKLKAFESILNAIDTENTDESLEAFHKNLEEHMQLEEGHLRRTLEKSK